jgi:hypothetical protein
MSRDKKGLDPAVLAAIITVIGGVIIALINVLPNLTISQPPEPTAFPTWTTIPTATIADTPRPTDTVAAGDATSTPAPDTPTPLPTSTPQPPALAEDWANGCISARWQAVPAGNQPLQENGCLQQPVGDFSVSNGRLVFLVNRRFSGAEVNGMFAPLPSQEGEVSLKVDLDVLDKGEIWMGVFSQPSIDSAGVVTYIPPGDIQKRLLVVLTLPGNTKNQTQQYNLSNPVYDVKFKYSVSSVVVSAMNDTTVFNPIGVASAQKWLFLGYRSGNNLNNIGASFFDLAFK